MTQTLADYGEWALIDALRARFPTGPAVLLGPGDDAAVLAASDGRIVTTTDLLIEGSHFRREWSGGHDVGRRAAAQNLADIAAMGAVPRGILVGLGAPADLPVDWLLALADGLVAECEPQGAAIAGGDVVAASAVTVSVTAFGDLEGREPLTRSGARAGDVVAVCGRLGWSAAGLAVLRRGFSSPRSVVEAFRSPAPPYDAGPEAVGTGATAMIDVSDGLLGDLGHLARASGATIDLDSSAFEVAEPLHAVGAALNVDPLRFVLTGGEDHALAATYPPHAQLPPRWRVIGRVAPGDPAPNRLAPAPEEAPRVTVDGRPYDGAAHAHFG